MSLEQKNALELHRSNIHSKTTRPESSTPIFKVNLTIKSFYLLSDINLEWIRDESLIKDILNRQDYIECSALRNNNYYNFSYHDCCCNMVIHGGVAYFWAKISFDSQTDYNKDKLKHVKRMMGLGKDDECGKGSTIVSRIGTVEDNNNCLELFRTLGILIDSDDDNEHFKSLKTIKGVKYHRFMNSITEEEASNVLSFKDKHNLSDIVMAKIFSRLGHDIVYLKYFNMEGILDENPTFALQLIIKNAYFKQIDSWVVAQNEPGFTAQNLKNAQDRLATTTDDREAKFLQYVIDCFMELKCKLCDKTIESDATFKFKTCLRRHCSKGYNRNYYHANCSQLPLCFDGRYYDMIDNVHVCKKYAEFKKMLNIFRNDYVYAVAACKCRGDEDLQKYIIDNARLFCPRMDKESNLIELLLTKKYRYDDYHARRRLHPNFLTDKLKKILIKKKKFFNPHVLNLKFFFVFVCLIQIIQIIR